eukprot:SAG31_NODE_335_length_17509_cov_7.127972_1_plen_255_part_10
MYVRLHTYDFVSSSAEQQRLAIVWAQATAAKLARVQAAYVAQKKSGVGIVAEGTNDATDAEPHNPAAAAPPDGSAGAASKPGVATRLINKVVGNVADGASFRVENIDVIVVGRRSKELASPRRGANFGNRGRGRNAGRYDSWGESQLKIKVRELSWTRYPLSSHEQINDQLLQSNHRLALDVDCRVDGSRFFSTRAKVDFDVDLTLGSFKFGGAKLSIVDGVGMELRLQQLGPFMKFMSWVQHAGCVLKYAAQRC